MQVWSSFLTNHTNCGQYLFFTILKVQLATWCLRRWRAVVVVKKKSDRFCSLLCVQWLWPAWPACPSCKQTIFWDDLGDGLDNYWPSAELEFGNRSLYTYIRSFLKIHFFIESGLKIIQFKIQLKTKSSVFIQKNIHSIESRMFKRIIHFKKNEGNYLKSQIKAKIWLRSPPEAPLTL